jgi:hypothetical protein
MRPANGQLASLIRGSNPSDTELVRIRAAELLVLQGSSRRAGRMFCDIGMPEIAQDEPRSPPVLAASQQAGRLWMVAGRADEPARYLIVRAENLVHGSDQQGCSPGCPAVMINGHVPAVHVPRDHSASRVVTPVPA